MNLLKKLFGREKRPKVRTRLSVEEIEPLFRPFGINVNSLNFPAINERFRGVFDRYVPSFDNIEIKPLVVEDILRARIKGDYFIHAATAYRRGDGLWQPGPEIGYSFKINEKGEMTFRVKR